MAKEMKPYFPVFLNLTEEKVVIVGAGTIAKRRIRTLISFTDHLTVIAPEVNKELKTLEAEGKLTILKKHFSPEDADGAMLVIAASSDKKENRLVYNTCKEKNILVNVCNTRENCDFYFSSVVKTEEIVIGVSSSGRNPTKGKQISAKIKGLLGICAAGEESDAS